MSSEDERKKIRDHIFGANMAKPKTKRIQLFGIDVEVRQPSLRAIMELKKEEDTKTRSARAILQYVCVPGTDTPVFEEADIEDILGWPFGDDMVRLNGAIAELTGINIDDGDDVDVTEAMKQVKSPLDVTH